MADLVLSAGRLALALVLVALNGFFVASEFALVRIRKTAVTQMVEENQRGSATLQAALDDLDDYLATTQLGITLASLGLGWVGEPAVAAIIEPALEPVVPAGTIHLVAFALGFGFITFLHVVFGELAPKTIAIQEAEQIALIVAPPMRLFYLLFVPGIVVFNGTANAATKLVGIEPASETEEVLGEEEIRLVLAQASSKGRVDVDEAEMIERVFELDDVTAREAMVPRPDVVSVPPGLSLDDLRSKVVEAGHTRYPVVSADGEDRIVGFVDVKDVLAAGQADGPAPTAADLARDLPVVPETVPLDDLLRDVQQNRRQMAAVVDEFGALEGIVTVEDILEVIVGELRDDFDLSEREPSIESRGEGIYEMDGRVSITAVNETLGTAFEPGSADTVAGLVLTHLGELPDVGDTVAIGGYRFEVAEMDGVRIAVLLVENADDEATDT